MDSMAVTAAMFQPLMFASKVPRSVKRPDIVVTGDVSQALMAP
jgi:hypothetical protein